MLLVNADMKQLEGDTLPCPRKLVLLHVRAGWTNEIVKDIHLWQTLDALFIQYDDEIHWPMALMDVLERHRILRHLCIIIEARRKRNIYRNVRWLIDLPMLGRIETGCRCFFILHPSLEGHPATSFVSAIYEDDENVKYGEVRGVSFENIVLSFPQFYTLFWQHVVSPLYTK